MSFRRFRAVQFASLAVLLGVAACSDSTGPSEDPITSENAEDVGFALVTGVYSAMGGLEHFDPTLGGGFLASVGRAPMAPSLSLGAFRAGCPEVTPAEPADTDADGVPDLATFSFDAADCDGADGDLTYDYSGSFHVTDPGAVGGYDLDVNNLRVQVSGNEGNFEAGFDGTRSVRATTSNVTLDEAFGFMFGFDDQSVLLLSAWELGFAAETPGSIAFGEPLPDGSVSVDGAYEVTAPEGRWVLVVTSVTPLAWDAACGDFTAGVLRAAAQGEEGAGAVQVTFQGCGVEPQIVFVGATS